MNVRSVVTDRLAGFPGLGFMIHDKAKIGPVGSSSYPTDGKVSSESLPYPRGGSCVAI